MRDYKLIEKCNFCHKKNTLLKKTSIFWIALYCPLLHFNIRTGFNMNVCLRNTVKIWGKKTEHHVYTLVDYQAQLWGYLPLNLH